MEGTVLDLTEEGELAMYEKTEDIGFYKIAEALDRLMTVDINARGSIGYLYKAAREEQGLPLTLAAVNLLQKAVKPGSYVIIATGWADQPWTAPQKGESDGPPGAIAIARTLRMTLKALPVIITDDYLMNGMERIARAGGFHRVPPENLINSLDTSAGFEGIPTISILPFPLGDEKGRAEAVNLLNRWKPVLCLSIERGGMNEKGYIHDMGGLDYFSETQGKIDYLFREAKGRGIPTIGIGDGGNEIGMGNIAETIREKIPYGKACKCPCGAGIAPVTPVDVLVTATISNWAGYAISALLAAKTGRMEAVPDEVVESRVLLEAANAGFHDSLGGAVRPGADGCSAEIHLAIVKLMREAVLQGCKRYQLHH